MDLIKDRVWLTSRLQTTQRKFQFFWLRTYKLGLGMSIDTGFVLTLIVKPWDRKIVEIFDLILLNLLNKTTDPSTSQPTVRTFFLPSVFDFVKSVKKGFESKRINHFRSLIFVLLGSCYRSCIIHDIFINDLLLVVVYLSSSLIELVQIRGIDNILGNLESQ